MVSCILSYTRSLHQYTAVAITATAAGAHTHAPHQLPRAHVKQWQCPGVYVVLPDRCRQVRFCLRSLRQNNTGVLYQIISLQIHIGTTSIESLSYRFVHKCIDNNTYMARCEHTYPTGRKQRRAARAITPESTAAPGTPGKNNTRNRPRLA